MPETGSRGVSGWRRFVVIVVVFQVNNNAICDTAESVESRACRKDEALSGRTTRRRVCCCDNIMILWVLGIGRNKSVVVRLVL